MREKGVGLTKLRHLKHISPPCGNEADGGNVGAGFGSQLLHISLLVVFGLREDKYQQMNFLMDGPPWPEHKTEWLLIRLKKKNQLYNWLASLGFSWGMWDLVPWPVIEPGPFALGSIEF